ncbi:enoyl-CoA hydratase [Phytoactinopolyspora halotolerans]|uniref:Enoyl-CoA hydratase n=1 Tax=Phytoactinopolyspora halotolerans TaxID=1981512 RepID=A0A6L9S1T4_9ACTN|nr:enoyl-CoA hydratase [Phytoactinopolyspora halotolerans]NED98571.1 enoyl-CoA hydratase [Phytoactinopolyspora halotolerans]
MAEVIADRDGHAVHVVLSNPGRRNALTWRMYESLDEILRSVNDDGTVRVVTVRGASGDGFAAGTDVQQFADFTSGDDGVAYERRVGAVLHTLMSVRVPVVAVVDGPAVGAGLAIAASCDVVLASDDATFGVPIGRTLGNCLTGEVMAQLQSRLGRSTTMAMLLTATLLSAADAAAAGLVHQVIAPAELDTVVADTVQRIAGCAPMTLAALKEVDRRLHAPISQVGTDDVVREVYASADFTEGVQAFLERRRPTWRGR